MGLYFPDIIGWHITKAENLRYTNAEHTMIDCDVDFSHVKDGPYTFTAYANDTEKHGRDLFAALSSGDYGPISEFVPPLPAFVRALNLRRALNKKGIRSDVEDYVKNSSQDIQDEWNFSMVLQRSGPFILALQNTLKISDEEMDDIFRLAIKE